MPVPLILGAAALLAGGIGIKKGFDAKEDFDRAERIGKNAQRKHESAVADLESAQNLTNKKFADLGKLKVDIFQNQIKHLVETIKRCQKNSKSTIKDFEEEISTDELKKMEQMVVKSLELGSAAGSGVASGALAAFGAWGGVQALAAASTGTAISTLSGAAATNATLAWLGGGALSAGGLGMAGGAAVLGGLVAGPALAVGGFMMASKAEEAVTEARKYEADIDEKVAKIGKAKVILQGLRANADEMSYNLCQLAITFERYKVYDNSDKSAFNRMYNLGKNIKDLLNTPIMEKDGTAVKNLGAKISGYMQICDSNIKVAEKVTNSANPFSGLTEIVSAWKDFKQTQEQ